MVRAHQQLQCVLDGLREDRPDLEASMKGTLRFHLKDDRWQLRDKDGEWLGLIPHGSENLALCLRRKSCCIEMAERLGTNVMMIAYPLDNGEDEE